MLRYEGFVPKTTTEPMRGYVYNPRPGTDQVITRTRLDARERLGAWAQIKKNGACTTLYVGPDRKVRVTNRRYDEHRSWAPIGQTHAAYRQLPRGDSSTHLLRAVGIIGKSPTSGNGWTVFCSELLHGKVRTRPGEQPLKNINFIHDMLVLDGNYLVGTTFEQRQKLLRLLFPDTVTPMRGVGYRVIDPFTWLAENYLPNPSRPGFGKLWDSLTRPEDEGLVLKMPQARLQVCYNESANDAWQFKCRLPTKNVAY